MTPKYSEAIETAKKVVFGNPYFKGLLPADAGLVAQALLDMHEELEKSEKGRGYFQQALAAVDDNTSNIILNLQMVCRRLAAAKTLEIRDRIAKQCYDLFKGDITRNGSVDWKKWEGNEYLELQSLLTQTQERLAKAEEVVRLWSNAMCFCPGEVGEDKKCFHCQARAYFAETGKGGK